MSRPLRNIELKACCPDPASVERAAVVFGFEFKAVLAQTDTYFSTSEGRLKLRESNGPGELIWYRRPDHGRSRASDYRLAAVSDPPPMRELLASVHGVRCVVRKVRRLLLWRNVRLHLDDVEGLGTYLEFEAVIGLDEDEVADGHDRINTIAKALSLDDADRVSGSYSDLIESKPIGSRSA